MYRKWTPEGAKSKLQLGQIVWVYCKDRVGQEHATFCAQTGKIILKPGLTADKAKYGSLVLWHYKKRPAIYVMGNHPAITVVPSYSDGNRGYLGILENGRWDCISIRHETDGGYEKQNTNVTDECTLKVANTSEVKLRLYKWYDVKNVVRLREHRVVPLDSELESGEMLTPDSVERLKKIWLRFMAFRIVISDASSSDADLK